MTNPALTIIIDFTIYAYLFRPIVDTLIERDVEIAVYCPSEIHDVVARELATSVNVSVRNLDDIKRRERNRWRVHRALQCLFTRADFSFQYGKKRHHLENRARGMNGFLLKVARFTPKVPNNRINAFLHTVTGKGLRNPFPTNKILVGSLNGSAELLCAREQQVYTVMESWDHAVKWPNGYLSTRVYAWNRSLAEDWRVCQADRDCVPFYPLKLRFAIQEVRAKALWQKAVRCQSQRPMCVYPAASTRRFNLPTIWCEMEDRIISDLIVATDAAGWDLFIKPRPNGMTGEFDHLCKGYRHVKVGSIVTDQSVIPANYFLTDPYNMQRFQELITADVVINAFTTFGLDAAAAGMPVLQLDLREAIGYEDSDLIFRNHHIEKYLLGTPGTFTVRGTSFRDAITNYLRAPDDLAKHYTTNLQRWLIPEITMDAALNQLVDDVLTGGE